MHEAYVLAFQAGIYFAYEDLTTQPAHLEMLSPFTARLSLVEGRYHQVKRMFGHFQNEVLALHRVSVGSLTLGGLELGESRLLTRRELEEAGLD
jgi:16S rRNA pseudouridine516 synthase